jgi:Zn-dependent protease
MSWKLGRVAGIDIYLHPTFLLILFLPQVTAGGLFSVALVLAAFGCVLLHELGHALMARQYGIATEDITLYPIGGVARLSRMPRSPGAELLIALAGPAVNVAIAAGLASLGILGIFADLAPESTVLGEFAANLVFANLVLAVFNLIPAFPMDGGRVLRALLSGWLGRLRATEIAAGLGRVLAVLFGIYSLINGMLPQFALAVFIYLASGWERSRVVVEENARRYSGGEGIWTAPVGYRWVHRGNGVWQLAPIVVNVRDETATPWR